MKTSDKKVKVEFAPGCFDDFEGSQEELEQLQTELLTMFSELTPEELSQRSRPIDLELLATEDPELAEKLLQRFGEESGRKLQ